MACVSLLTAPASVRFARFANSGTIYANDRYVCWVNANGELKTLWLPRRFNVVCMDIGPHIGAIADRNGRIYVFNSVTAKLHEVIHDVYGVNVMYMQYPNRGAFIIHTKNDKLICYVDRNAKAYTTNDITCVGANRMTGVVALVCGRRHVHVTSLNKMSELCVVASWYVSFDVSKIVVSDSMMYLALLLHGGQIKVCTMRGHVQFVIDNTAHLSISRVKLCSSYVIVQSDADIHVYNMITGNNPCCVFRQTRDIHIAGYGGRATTFVTKKLLDNLNTARLLATIQPSHRIRILCMLFAMPHACCTYTMFDIIRRSMGLLSRDLDVFPGL